MSSPWGEETGEGGRKYEQISQRRRGDADAMDEVGGH